MSTVVIVLPGLAAELLFGREEHQSAAALLEGSAFGVLDEVLPLDPALALAVLRAGADAGAIGCYGSRDRSGRVGLALGRAAEPPDRLAAVLGGDRVLRLVATGRDGIEGACDRIVAALAAGEHELVELVDDVLLRVQRDHPDFMQDEEQAEAVLGAYAALDRGLGRIAAALGDTDRLLLVSPTSVQPSAAVFRINDWLRAEGLLVLASEPAGDTALEEAAIDWRRTKAFALGGAEGRIYLNVVGRDPEGSVPAAEASALREDLADRLARLVGADGAPLQTVVLKSEEAFDDLAGVAPDLLVVVDGHAVPVVDRLDAAGADHERRVAPGIVLAQGGSFLLRAPGSILEGEIPSARLQDLLPTLIDLAGLEPPAPPCGRSLLDGLGEGGRDRALDEEAAQRRLRGLGYL